MVILLLKVDKKCPKGGWGWGSKKCHKLFVWPLNQYNIKLLRIGERILLIKYKIWLKKTKISLTANMFFQFSKTKFSFV
jgi:hypothetical protein